MLIGRHLLVSSSSLLHPTAAIGASRPPPHAALLTMKTLSRSRPPGAAPLPRFAYRGFSRRQSLPFPVLGWFVLGIFFAIVFVTSAADSSCSYADDFVRDVCVGSSSFCFPSTLVGFGSRGDSCLERRFLAQASGTSSKWRPGDVAAFKMANGGVVSCSLVDSVNRVDDELSYDEKNSGGDDVTSCMAPLVTDVWMRTSSGITADLDEPTKDVDPGLHNASSSLNVEISPHFLDWGEKSLYTPSIASLTLTNAQKNDTLHVYEPFSTDPQYHAYGFQKLTLAPGESTSIPFVYLPRWLGSSFAHLVLQTNAGGFIIQARGVAVESPYKIEPSVGINVSDNKWLSRNFSLYNPFDDVLHVEELSASFSLSGHTEQSVHVVCRVDSLKQLSTKFSHILTGNEWFRLEGSTLGVRWLDIRPHKHWEVSAQKTQPILEVQLWPYTEGKVLGASCLKMWSSRRDKISTIVLPLELEVYGKTVYSDSSGSVTVDIEALEPYNRMEMIILISLRNEGADLLRLVNISEITEGSNLFRIRYKEGLLLLPGTVTKIASVSYSSPIILQNIEPEIPTECKLLIVTNNSDSSVINIPCLDMVYASIANDGSGIIASDGSCISWPSQNEQEQHTNEGTGSLQLQSIEDALFPIKPKLLETFEADELILRNWVSQGSGTETSVLEEQELSFPVVPVGTHFSKWIAVHNPSQQPVVMQLVLNSGEVIGHCKSADELFEHTFSSRFTEIDSPKTRIGFSLSDSAVTEAFVHPSQSLLFGPVIFHPSNRCMWRSSALIRNNLSGAEWFPIQAFGGSHLLILLEGLDPVWKLEFNLHSPMNMTSSDFSSRIENASTLCGHQLSKEIYAKNIGDLPLEIKKLKVSGTDCGLDGFTINRCKHFTLEPGESMRLVISYKPDFSTYVVHRDLELALATGIFVIPMKASLPFHMFKHCKKTFLQPVNWKASLLVLAAISTLLLFIRILPQSIILGTEDYYDKIDNTMSRGGKTCRNNSIKISRSTGEDENSKAKSVNKYHNGQNVMLDNSKKAEGKQDFGYQKEVTFSPPTNLVKVLDQYSMLEARQSNSLTIRVVREKSRRRKRKATGIGLANKLEVSSSQSGNSTPSSPLSPNASTPKQAWPLSPESDDTPFAGLSSEQKYHIKYDSGDTMGVRVSEAKRQDNKTAWIIPSQVQSTVTPKSTRNPASFSPVNSPESILNVHCVTSPGVIATCSPISPPARAPGSKTNKDKAIKMEGNDGIGKEFTYDIWGNHFSHNFLVRQKVTKTPDASEGDSQSFFASDPQSLMMMSSAWSVSPGQNMPPDNVTCFDQMN